MSSPVTLLVEVVMGTPTHPSSSPVPGLLPFSSILFDYPWIFIHLYESYTFEDLIGIPLYSQLNLGAGIDI